MAWPEPQPLGKRASVIAGQSPEGRYYNNAGQGLPFYQGKKDFGERELQPPTVWTSKTTKEARAGDILMSVRAPVGPINFARDDVCIGRGLAAIRCRDGLDPNFLFYQLLGMQADISGKEGAVFASINRAQIEALLIVVPELDEQRRIVAILDEAFEGIATAKANAERNLQNARELADALGEACFDQHIDDRFTSRDLASLCEFIVDCEHKTAPTQEHGYPSIRTPNVGKGKLILDDVNRVSEETYAAWTRRAVPLPGDLILAREAPAGNVAVIPHGMQVCLGQRTVLIRPRRDVFEPKYLVHLLLQRSSQRRLLAHSRGATVQHVNMKDIRAFMIASVPSLDTQRKVVEWLAQMEQARESVEATQRQKLSALDELTKSLLHQAFTGQLLLAKPTSLAQQPAVQTTTPEFAANVIAFAHARHERQKRDKTFGRVKAQKVLHLVEAIAKIDLGRQPMKDAAGPNDFEHMLQAEEWAKAHNFFDMVKHDKGYEFRKFSAFDARLSSALRALEPHRQPLERVIDLLVPMDKVEAEVFATVHAAWNNLLIEGTQVTDQAIVRAARGDWHADKLNIPEDKFRTAIALIRQKGLVPDGKAKYVGGQQSLL